VVMQMGTERPVCSDASSGRLLLKYNIFYFPIIQVRAKEIERIHSSRPSDHY
jgi:hypothetical protein